MRLNRRVPLVLAVLCLPGCIVGGPLTVSEVQEETRRLDAGGQFSLENVNGRIHVGVWDEPRVKIEAVKRAASHAALRDVRVEIEGEGARVAVRTRTPRRWIGIGRGAEVEYHVILPRGASASLESVNGRVEAAGVAGELEAETVNGRITVTQARGRVRAATVNGAVEVAYARADPDARHEFSTTNGRIEVTLPEGTGGRLEARTVNGRIRCDLPLEDERAQRRRLDGRLGAGRGAFELSTVNGSIRIQAGGPARAAAP